MQALFPESLFRLWVTKANAFSEPLREMGAKVLIRRWFYLFGLLIVAMPFITVSGEPLENRHNADQSTEIVTIDVNDPDAPSQLLRAYAATGVGYLSGVTLASEVMRQKILDTARHFFHGYSPSEKAKFRFGVPGYVRGYTGPGSEQYGTTHSSYREHYVESLDIVNGMKPSDWPESLRESGLMAELEAYRKEASAAASSILSLIEKALSLETGFLVNQHRLEVANSTFRLNLL